MNHENKLTAAPGDGLVPAVMTSKKDVKRAFEALPVEGMAAFLNKRQPALPRS